MSYIRDSKHSFVVYYDFERQTELLSNEQLGRLLRLMFDYEIRQKEPDNTDELFMIFQFVKAVLDINREKYEAICEQNSINGKKGGKKAKGNQTEGSVPFPDSWS